MALISKYSLNGNANDLVWSNNWTATNVTWVDGKMNQWWSFNGSSSYITIPDNNVFDGSWWNISMCAMIRPTTLKDSYFLSKDDVTNRSWTFDTTNYAWQMWKLDALFFTGGGYSYAYTTNQNVIVAWVRQHVGVTRDVSGIIRFYINGDYVPTTMITTTSWGIINTSADVIIWKRNYAPAPWVFDWLIDEVEIHDNVLSDVDFKNKYLYYNGFYNV